METHSANGILTPFERVRAVLVNSLGLSPEEIQPQTKFRELGVDSLEMAQLLLDLEDDLNLEIPEDDLVRVHTVADVVNYL